MVARVTREVCLLCGEVVDKAAECGAKESGGVEAVEEEVVADVSGVWTITSVEIGRTKVKGWRRLTKALRRWSAEVALVHKNNFGVEVDFGDLPVSVVEASAQVFELDVAQVNTEMTIDSAAEESVCPIKWGRMILGSRWWTSS